MKRDIDQHLLNWSNQSTRLPLLLRGARQVGKSYSVRQLGTSSFEEVVEINFEQHPEFAVCFKTLVPREILDQLELLTRRQIEPGRTLLFLDEIQKCPAAITALRYFREQLPRLHVIAAGSLLDFALESDTISVPVGRIQYLFVKPMSFGEFLDAVGEHRLRALVRQGNLAGITLPVHERLLSLVKKYSVIGGMPAAVQQYTQQQSIAPSLDIQTSITQTFRDDFGKYAKRAKHEHLESVFAAAAKMAGRRFKYSHVDPSARSADLKAALHLLEQASVVYRVRATSGAGQPLEAEADERAFKMLFLDIGLMQNLCGLSEESVLCADLLAVYAGALAEQFVGQELMAHQNPLRQPALFFWNREGRTSTAEVDYLYPHGSLVLPLEVKAGAGGTLRSAHLFLARYHRPLVIRISQLPFGFVPPVLSVPLYAVEALPKLLEQTLGRDDS